jgi:hypothetical protein
VQVGRSGWHSVQFTPHSYHKVLDNRKRPIRHFWRQGGQFNVRITIEDDGRRKVVKPVALYA